MILVVDAQPSLSRAVVERYGDQVIVLQSPRRRPRLWRVGKFKRALTALYFRRCTIARRRHFEQKNPPIRPALITPGTLGRPERAADRGKLPQRGARARSAGSRQPGRGVQDFEQV